MAYDQLDVMCAPEGSMPGSDEEHFILVLLDSTLPQHNFMWSSSPLTETALRAQLQQRGLTPLEIEARLHQARTSAS